MSLINDALKKTQKLQSEQPGSAHLPSPSPAGPAAAPVVIRRGKPVGFESMLLGIITAVVVLVGGTVIVVLALKREEKPMVTAAAPVPVPSKAVPAAAGPATSGPAITYGSPVPKETPVAVVPPPAAAAQPTPQPVAPAPASPAAVNLPVTTAATPPASATPPTVSVQLAASPPPLPAAKPAELAVAPVVAPPPRVPEAPKPNIKTLTFIDNLRVAGVRSAGSDSKVLMNDRVYRVNDMVDYELGLRLTGVSTSVLTFVDDNGVVYTKNL